MNNECRLIRVVLFSLLACLLAAGQGCDGSKRYAVTGTVVFEDDKPATELAGSTVQFDPLAGKEGARGEVGSDGTFTMSTNQPNDGVAPGEYRVSIQPPLPRLDSPVKRVMAQRFEDVNTSDLRVVVNPEKNHITLKVERAKPEPQ